MPAVLRAMRRLFANLRTLHRGPRGRRNLCGVSLTPRLESLEDRTLLSVNVVISGNSASFTGLGTDNLRLQIVGGDLLYSETGAAGSYTNQWNFGSRTGVATVNFDGASFGGGITPNTIGSISNSNFQTIAPMAATNGGLAAGRSLNLNGSFTSSASTVAAGQMGNFSITGPNYQAGGSFAAQK